ncbi:hypothetical protein SPBR_09097 [Sporothrix brasiliensis 5110]|uniref:Uncharacterized protein n=1 Tax=Sporothrix brasiliensis 5110 TaxID=1398154 RepID=A0A0C2J3K4_9PEZI|nr:uncharacterized protein SPBR_09097 [Sporothrix brasiliensis 5110]KIH91627.1 hypothetical protein SPBR_09097 [Sporothrix brasiliensis 5110]
MPEDAPYDPYIPSGEAAPAQGAGGGSRTQALQAFAYVSPLMKLLAGTGVSKLSARPAFVDLAAPSEFTE